MPYSVLKRLLDVVVSAAVLLVTAPIMMLAIVLISRESKGGAVFIQPRLGKDGKVFQLYKLRSMTVDNMHHSAQVYGAAPGITRVGRVIRRFKVDELPQLFNVLMGDMSLVGPRPCLPALRQEFNGDGEIRLRVRPGMTGLAQVSGNIYLDWPQRWAFDRRYVEQMSLGLDMQILVRTVLVVVLGEKRFLKS